MESPEELLDELASTELTDEEVRAILVRFGAGDHRVKTVATLADLGKAMGIPVVALGLVLADIRGHFMEARLSAVIESHERRIRELEKAAEHPYKRIFAASIDFERRSLADLHLPPELRNSDCSLEVLQEFAKIAHQRDAARKSFNVAVIVIAVLLSMAGIIGALGSEMSSPTVSNANRSSYESNLRDYSGRVIIVGSDGSVREPITDEEHAHTTELMKAEASSNRR